MAIDREFELDAACGILFHLKNNLSGQSVTRCGNGISSNDERNPLSLAFSGAVHLLLCRMTPSQLPFGEYPDENAFTRSPGNFRGNFGTTSLGKHQRPIASRTVGIDC